MSGGPRVTVIAPVLDERETIRSLIESLLAQTRPPDQIVVGDGGSTDGTREILTELEGAHPILRVVEGAGGISENRNAAIAAADGEIIACTDAGCLPEPDWLAQLTAPFADGAGWVAGIYRPEGATLAATCAGLVIMSVPDEVDPREFIPAGNSQAFLKEAWAQVGGFPEGMVAAEDTLFGERLRAAGYQPVFRPQAVVRWDPPPSLGAMVRKAIRWGRADGEARLRDRTYLKVIALYWAPIVVAGVSAVSGRRRWAALVLAPVAAVTALRTRFKYRWADGAPKYGLIPLAHILAALAQSLGWALGRFVRPRSGGPPPLAAG